MSGIILAKLLIGRDHANSGERDDASAAVATQATGPAFFVRNTDETATGHGARSNSLYSSKDTWHGAFQAPDKLFLRTMDTNVLMEWFEVVFEQRPCELSQDYARRGQITIKFALDVLAPLGLALCERFSATGVLLPYQIILTADNESDFLEALQQEAFKDSYVSFPSTG